MLKTPNEDLVKVRHPLGGCNEDDDDDNEVLMIGEKKLFTMKVSSSQETLSAGEKALDELFLC